MSWLGIQELRKAVGISAKELAEKIGKDATYISKIEKGNIINTSYETIRNMAQVIANSEAITSGKVDLSEYESEFSKLVLSHRYDYMRDVYEYIKRNKEVEEYSQIIRNLNEDDLNTFKAVISQRRSEKRYNQIKYELKTEILKQSNSKNVKSFFKDLQQRKQKITFEIEIDAEGFLVSDFNNYITSLLDLFEDNVEAIKTYGIENIISETGYDLEEDYMDKE